MEYLFTINPILNENSSAVIYGCGQDSMRIFRALLQQHIRVSYFCARRAQGTHIKEIFGRRVLDFEELAEKAGSAHVIISGKNAPKDAEELKAIGVKNIIVENITSDAAGILIDDE